MTKENYLKTFFGGSSFTIDRLKEENILTNIYRAMEAYKQEYPNLYTNQDSYLNENIAIARLVEEWEEYGKLIIAYDFDDTIFDLHEKGYTFNSTIELVKRAAKEGHILCMWTAVPDQWSIAYKKYIAKELGILPKYINNSPVMNDSRKPHFSILLDDRAGIASAFYVLTRVLDEIDIIKNSTVHSDEHT